MEKPHEYPAQPALEYAELNEGLNALKAGLTALQALAYPEYHTTLAALQRELGNAEGIRPAGVLRWNRLLGVLLKMPFAKAVALSPPSETTTAYRGWQWQPAALTAPQAQRRWQYQTLQALNKEWYNANDASPEALAAFVDVYGTVEGGLSMLLLQSVGEHLCGNRAVEAALQAAMEQAEERGFNLRHPLPAALLLHLGVGVCASIGKTMARAGFPLGPIAGGLTLLLLSIGKRGLCDWINAGTLWELIADERAEQEVAE